MMSNSNYDTKKMMGMKIGKKRTLHYSSGGGWQDTSIKHNAC